MTEIWDDAEFAAVVAVAFTVRVGGMAANASLGSVAGGVFFGTAGCEVAAPVACGFDVVVGAAGVALA